MHTRLAAAALAAAALLALTACSSSDSNDDKAAPSQTPSVTSTSAAGATEKSIPGIPDKPTGAKRDAYIAAIAAVDPTLTADPDKAITNGRNQCTSLDGGARDVDHSAAERFGTGTHPLTDDQGKAINAALRLTLCPKQ